jgi:cysteine desulfurase family protein (TIGR01976 family)
MAALRSDSTTAALDLAAVRRRFPSLDRGLAFFDGPAGTQVPDTVIEAIAGYLRTSNANVGGAFETSRESDALVEGAHAAAARFLRCEPGETFFGPNMTTLNFALSRTAARGWGPDDEVVVTRLDHDANVAPWLELAEDLGLRVRFCELTDDCRLDLEHLESLVGPATRVVAFPVASNAVGTLVDVRRVADIAHSVGALAWADAVHYGPHGPIDVAAWDVDVLLCSAYKFFGPHLGLGFGKTELLDSWRPYKARPSPTDPVGRRFETGTLQHELLAGFVAAAAYVTSLGWEAICAHERALGERFLAGLPRNVGLHGLSTMDGRVPTFALQVDGLSPAEAARRLGDRGYAVWHGDYYALEVMRALSLADGALRVGIVHYNTDDEVDGLLAELASL